jgi:RND family efflux transporter MFP subunit
VTALPSTAPANDEGLLGVMIAPETVDVTSQVEGRLKEIKVRVGDRVAQGDWIAKLDTRSARQELNMASAELATARTELQRAELELAQAGERVSRRETLADLGDRKVSTVSGEELSSSRYQRKLAAVKLSAAEANVREKAAHLELLRVQVAEGKVEAPFDGTVVTRYVDRGALIHKGTPIVRIIESGDLKVRFALPEERANALGVDDKVRIVAGDLELSGTVEKVAPEIDAATRMIFAEASLDAPTELRGRIRSGLVAHVWLLHNAETARR